METEKIKRLILYGYSRGFAYIENDFHAVEIYGTFIVTISGYWRYQYQFNTYDEFREFLKDKTLKERLLYQELYNKAQDMSWLTEELHTKLAKHEDKRIRLLIACYSSKFHCLLKDDEDEDVRAAVAYKNSEYHDELVNDEAWQVRKAVAETNPQMAKKLLNDRTLLVKKTAGEHYRKFLKKHKEEK